MNIAFYLIFACIFLIFLVALRWLLNLHRIAREFDKIPGPPRSFLPIGHYRIFRIKHDGFFKDLRKFHSAFQQSNEFGFLRLWLGPIPYLIIGKGAGAEVILSSYKFLEKGPDYDLIQPWLATGLLTSTGDKWRERRKFLTPTFHFQTLCGFLPIFNKQSLVFADQLANEAKQGSAFDIYPFVTHCTLDIICETAMGRQIHAQHSSSSEYVKAVYKASELVYDRALKPWFQNDILYHLFGQGKEHDGVLRTLHRFTDSVIAERMEERRANKPVEHKHMAFLDLLLNATTEDGKPLDRLSIREEVDTFMFEGHDTTSAAVGFAIFLLGAHPEVQEMAQRETDLIFGTSNRAVTNEDLKEMPYLEKVIKETHRLFPSVPNITRKVKEDIKIGPYVVPAGVIANIFIFQLHRDPTVFPDPGKFDPERFEGGGAKLSNPFDYVPFSAGPRNCIGQKFALMEEKVILSTVLRRFNIRSMESLAEFEVQGELITRPLNGIKVRLDLRVNKSTE